MREQRKRARVISIASSLMILIVGLVPAASAADHLDSPLVSQAGATDITDIYAFSTKNRNATVLIVGVIFILGAEINAALLKYRVKHIILDKVRGVKKPPPVVDDSMEDEAIAREQGAKAGR